jgi:prepilin-type N-terminal cleavage/methylation domain-containing protein
MQKHRKAGASALREIENLNMSSTGARRANGFTVVELVIAMALFALVTAFAVPRASDAMRIARVDRASRAVAVDLEQAIGMAARQRTPIRVRQPNGTRQMVSQDRNTSTVYRTTDLGDDTRVGLGVETLTLNPTQVDVFPTGRVSAALTVTIVSGDYTRTVTMSQAGQIRVF